METLERCFKGLADQSRLRILNLLLHGELCVCDIQHVLSAAQANVSRHLIYLKNAGLVSDRRDGYRVFYRLSGYWDSDGRGLAAFLREATQRNPVMQTDVQALRLAIREGACTVSAFRPYAGLRTLKGSAHARR